MHRRKPTDYALAFLLLALFILVGYAVQRHETTPLLVSYSLLFAVYVIIIRKLSTFGSDTINYWTAVSILLRASLLFAVPTLSDDFYRFIWDGRVLAAGANPFQHIPSHYMTAVHALPGLDEELYNKLNSQHRYSSYPPVCQIVYWVSVKLSPGSLYGSVLVMKSILLLFEIGTLQLIKKLATRFAIPTASVLLYALNPLVILEISGNAHFEGIMVFFFLAAILFLTRQKTISSATAYALSVCTKLIPLILLPLMLHPLGRKLAFRYWAAVGIAIIVLYLPLVSVDISEGYTTSLGYYFQYFEFNASVYYLVRAAGELLVGYNIIQLAGPILALVAAVIILTITFRPKAFTYTDRIDRRLFQGMTWCLLVYFLFTTTLHPWYIITLLVVSLFAGYRFAVAWTGLIFFTYAGYSETGYQENFVVVALEYTVVIVFFLSETLWKPRQTHFS